MIPIKPPLHNVTYAENQKEYVPFPVYKAKDGQVVCCFELTEDEKLEIQKTGKIFLRIATFNLPLQPILLTVMEREVYTMEEAGMIKEGS